MNNYEAMLILNPDLKEEEKKQLLENINQTITKNQGKISSSDIWSDKRRLTYSIKRLKEGLYYLIKFSILPENITKLKQAWRLDEKIVRSLILKSI